LAKFDNAITKTKQVVVVAAAKRVVEEGEMHDQEEEAVRTL